jgi:hypothetical protein
MAGFTLYLGNKAKTAVIFKIVKPTQALSHN